MISMSELPKTLEQLKNEYMELNKRIYQAGLAQSSYWNKTCLKSLLSERDKLVLKILENEREK
jgi:hypothetical protein